MMKLLFAVLFATVYGLVMRLLFGFFDGFLGIMSVTFLMLVPVTIGFLTVILLPYKKNHTAAGAFFKPWITSLAILIVTMLFNIEGVICWIMIFPVFAIFAGFGGIIAYKIKKHRAYDDPDEMDIDRKDWDQPNSLQVSLLFFIPLLAGFLEGNRVLAPQECVITKTVIIPAPTTAVWKELTAIGQIHPREHHHSFSDIIGFPKHLQTTMDTLAVGGKRIAVYEKGLYFTETITSYEPGKWMALRIKTDPANIPPTVMDEHIVIGGKHVDVLEDIYRLEPLPDGHSRLMLSSRFYINTPFNWYASIWAKYLMSGILEGELNLLKERASAKNR